VPDNAAPERPVSIKGSCTLRCVCKSDFMK
jgi:hypothetical protein